MSHIIQMSASCHTHNCVMPRTGDLPDFPLELAIPSAEQLLKTTDPLLQTPSSSSPTSVSPRAAVHEQGEEVGAEKGEGWGSDDELTREAIEFVVSSEFYMLCMRDILLHLCDKT